MRFRSFRVALTADIEKAFLMISVAESDRDVLRFLWVDDLHSIKGDPPLWRVQPTEVPNELLTASAED